ncbi:O-antigen translocase [Edwardsiella tarda]|nr:O-antigen translocase [Edwardsiella tarda]
MSLARASLWTAGSTLIKIGAGLVVVKLLAVAFGPVGVGQAANFRQVITVLGVLSGAGIFNGITKYVAEYRQQPEKLQPLLGTASTMILAFSLLLALIFVAAARPISEALFGDGRYQAVIRLLALLQMGIACSNYGLAVIKGYRDARGNALAVAGGSLLGVAAYALSYLLGGVSWSAGRVSLGPCRRHAASPMGAVATTPYPLALFPSCLGSCVGDESG